HVDWVVEVAAGGRRGRERDLGDPADELGTGQCVDRDGDLLANAEVSHQVFVHVGRFGAQGTTVSPTWTGTASTVPPNGATSVSAPPAGDSIRAISSPATTARPAGGTERTVPPCIVPTRACATGAMRPRAS